MNALEQIGGPVACLGLALLLVARTRRDRLAGLGFAILGAVVLGVALAPDAPLKLTIGVAAALAAAGAAAIAFRLVPWLLPLAALACVPGRVNVHLAGAGSKLLVPLYVLVLGAAMLLAWELVRGDTRTRELGAAAWPLAAFVGWTGVSLVWSKDVHAGAIELLAFYLPFTLLALAVARLPWSRLGMRALYIEVTLMALVFAVVGFYQYETRDIFQNPKVINANAYAQFFRVNSVFWDPSVYGRFLVVAIVPGLVLLVSARARVLAPVAAAAIAVIWVGLLISFSQSSFAALLVAVVGAALVAWRWRALVAVAAAAAVLVGIAAAQPTLRRSIEHHTSAGLNSATSGRASLVANGIRIAESHPLAGVGVGGFRRAYAERVHIKGKEPKKAASHDTPVTVAAETGIVGLALFAWLVVALGVQTVRRMGRTLPGRVALTAGLALAAILVHSLFYNDFVEDPTTWLLLGLLALAVSERDPAPAGARAEVEPREAVPA
ncbi:MAG TPA: O-antigen ligase family protein [Gaiellaceae bacterium]|nr:O-antigen ligase family protein [Gaiellaceae bacterium]